MEILVEAKCEECGNEFETEAEIEVNEILNDIEPPRNEGYY